MTEETKRRIAELAATAERDIDEGRIKLTGPAADRELARLAELKHEIEFRRTHDAAPRCTLCGGALVFVDTTADGRIDPGGRLKCESCGHVDSRGAGELRELVEGLLGKETPESRAAVQNYFREAPTRPAKLRMAHLAGDTAFPTEREADALAFCFRIALEHDHGGARRLRSLLYAWHNKTELGGFDFSDLWSLDDTYRAHALTVIGMIARSPQGWYAEHYGYAADMAAIVETYGPHR